jgi:hypothetical protein
MRIVRESGGAVNDRYRKSGNAQAHHTENKMTCARYSPVQLLNSPVTTVTDLAEGFYKVE